MPESLAERLRKVIEHLRFLGKNQEADIIAMLIRRIIELREFSDIEETENILILKNLCIEKLKEKSKEIRFTNEYVPTIKEIDDVCLSYRHDFGLLDSEQKDNIRHTAKNWLIAWKKTLPKLIENKDCSADKGGQ